MGKLSVICFKHNKWHYVLISELQETDTHTDTEGEREAV
jgi:hypothetical protein